MQLHFIFIILYMCPRCWAWHTCDAADGGGICPTGNTCCSVPGRRSSTCITSHEEHAGTCCTDFTDDVTGCGDGFDCVQSASEFYCQRRNASDDALPPHLPRYKLCALPPTALQQVHGFAVDNTTVSLGSAPLPLTPEPVLAYLSNLGALDATDPATLARQQKVTTMVVMIHGSGRNADDYLCCTSRAFASAMVLTPWFVAPEDGVVNTTDGRYTVLQWAEDGPIPHTWRYGANAINAPTSSYAAVDAMVDHVLDAVVRFPQRSYIVVAGHSAGGQFTQRWALLSNARVFATDNSRVMVRVAVANPKSFCYLDARRYVDNGEFRVPDDDDVDLCPWYNEWEWGLGEGDTLDTPYKVQAIAQAGGTAAVVTRYAHRDVVYLAGGLDVIPNGMCWAKLQGDYRLERSRRFYESLRAIYGHYVHRRVVIPHSHHDHCLMFQSDEAYAALIGDHGNAEQ